MVKAVGNEPYHIYEDWTCAQGCYIEGHDPSHILAVSSIQCYNVPCLHHILRGMSGERRVLAYLRAIKAVTGHSLVTLASRQPTVAGTGREVRASTGDSYDQTTAPPHPLLRARSLLLAGMIRYSQVMNFLNMGI